MNPSPDWTQCIALRQQCQSEIFRKMDAQHKESMDLLRSIEQKTEGALAVINEKLAFQAGEQAAARHDLTTEIGAQEAARVDARAAVAHFLQQGMPVAPGKAAVTGLRLSPREIVMILAAFGSLIAAVIIALKGHGS